MDERRRSEELTVLGVRRGTGEVANQRWMSASVWGLSEEMERWTGNGVTMGRGWRAQADRLLSAVEGRCGRSNCGRR
jgi:hypothetical protein